MGTSTLETDYKLKLNGLPDLNPIEHLWDELGMRVRSRRPLPVNRVTLTAALREEWEAIPQDTIRRLTDSMRQRCIECVAAQGRHTHY